MEVRVFLRAVMCISKSIRYLLFHYDNLFNRKCYSSFQSEEMFFIKLIEVDNYPVIKLVPLDP